MKKGQRQPHRHHFTVSFRTCLAAVTAALSVGLHVLPAQSAAPPSDGVWEPAPSLNVARFSHAAAPGPDGRIYALGGQAPTAPAPDPTVEVFDPANASAGWTFADQMATPRYQFAAALGPDDRIYALGGLGAAKTAEAYTPGANGAPGVWAPIPPMNASRYGLAATTGRGVTDRRVYAIGGVDTTATSGNLSPTGSAEAFRPGQGTDPGRWETLPGMNVARARHTAATGLDGRIYAIGGSTTGGSAGIAAVEVFDPSDRDLGWVEVAPMLRPRSNPAAATGPDGRIYAIGGQNGNTSEKTVEVYDPDTNSWAYVASMSITRASHGAAIGSDGRLYAIAGLISSNNPIKTVEALTFPPPLPPTTTTSTLTPPTTVAPEPAPGGEAVAARSYATSHNKLCDEGAEPSPRRSSVRWGDPDPSFDCDGKVITTVANDSGRVATALAVAVDPRDGQVVLSGQTLGSGATAAVARFDRDGKPDRSFGNGGSIIDENTFDRPAGVATSSDSSAAKGVAVQADGKIVIAVGNDQGSSSHPLISPSAKAARDLRVVRYNTDGSRDGSFGTNGLARSGFSDADAYAVVLQPDRKIMVAGVNGRDFALSRFHQDGRLDESFGVGGRVVTDVNPGHEDVARSVVVQVLDGSLKIVAAGTTSNSAEGGSRLSKGFALARYSEDGSLDPSFNNSCPPPVSCGGRATIALAGGGPTASTDSGAHALAAQPDGKLIVGGWANSPQKDNGTDFALARLRRDGTLDPSFDGDGKVFTDFKGKTTTDHEDERVYGVVIKDNGGIVAVGEVGGFDNLPGHSVDSFRSNLGLAGFDSAGLPTFSVVSDSFAATRGIAMQSGGDTVVGGMSRPATGSTGGFAAARYDNAGAIDKGFGKNGQATSTLGGLTRAHATTVARRPNGTLVTAGPLGNGGGPGVMAAYTAEGSIDASFGGGAFIVDYEPVSVASDGDGRTIVLGTRGIGTNRKGFIFARYHPDGTVDQGFGTAGRTTVSGGEPYDLTLQDDGSVVGVGESGSDQPGNFMVVRLSEQGHLDPGFGSKGRVFTASPRGSSSAQAVIIQPDGKIVAGGFGIRMARYNKDGSLDGGFGQAGTVIDDQRGLGAEGLALQPDGKIVVAVNTESQFAVARYRADGSPDTEFNRCPPGRTPPNTACGGWAITPIPGYETRNNPNDLLFPVQDRHAPTATTGRANRVAVEADGRIVATGFGPGGTAPGDFVLARYTREGALDVCGSPGTVRARFGFGAIGSDMVLQPDGKVVVAGRYYNLENVDAIALARFEKGGEATSPPTSVGISDVRVDEPSTGAADATFKVKLDSPACKRTTVDFTTVKGSATPGDDFEANSGTVVFEPGQQEQPVVVAVKADSLAEPTEDFYVEISNPKVGTGASSPLDALAPPPPALSISKSRGVGEILDPSKTLNIGDVVVPEPSSGSAPATFTVTLSGPTEKPIALDYATAEGTAKAGVDYTPTKGTLTIPIGATAATIAVPVLGDGLSEPTEEFYLEVSGAENAFVDRSRGKAEILDPAPASRWETWPPMRATPGPPPLSSPSPTTGRRARCGSTTPPPAALPPRARTSSPPAPPWCLLPARWPNR